MFPIFYLLMTAFYFVELMPQNVLWLNLLFLFMRRLRVKLSILASHAFFFISDVSSDLSNFISSYIGVFAALNIGGIFGCSFFHW